MEDWSEIVALHGQALWRTAFRLLGNQSDAADCVQEAFALAVKISRRQPVRNWPALLRRLGTTQAVEMLRRRVRQRKHFESAELADVKDPAPGPADFAQAAESAEALRKALARLPRQQAVVFTLRFIEGMGNDEIAESLGLTANAVGVLIHRARSGLRQLMAATAGAGESQVQHE